MSLKKVTLSVATCAAAASLGAASQAARASHPQIAYKTQSKGSNSSHDLDCSQSLSSRLFLR